MVEKKEIAKTEKRILGPVGGSRGDDNRTADRALAAEMLVRGNSAKEIAEAITKKRDYYISTATVRGDIAAVRKQWVEEYLRDYDGMKAKELARIDALERVYWDAWERSKKPLRETQASRIKDTHKNKEGDVVQEYERKTDKSTNKQYIGDKTFLQGIQWCIQQRAKILGLDAPMRYEINWRKEAEAAGIQPNVIYESLVAEFEEALESGLPDGTQIIDYDEDTIQDTQDQDTDT